MRNGGLKSTVYGNAELEAVDSVGNSRAEHKIRFVPIVLKNSS